MNFIRYRDERSRSRERYAGNGSHEAYRPRYDPRERSRSPPRRREDYRREDYGVLPPRREEYGAPPPRREEYAGREDRYAAPPPAPAPYVPYE